MSKSLTDKTISGLNWNFVRNNFQTLINLIVGVVLARLLSPQDFGLLGMTYIFTGFADLFATLGMGSSVIRIKNLKEEHIRVATTITLVSSIVIYFIFWFSAPWIAEFYKEERIVSILRALSTIFIIKGIVTVSYSQIMKALDFKYILVIELSSFTLGYGMLSSTLALFGFGVWSLVYGRLASAVISSSITLWKVPVNLKPLIRKKEFKDLVGFGSGVSLSRLFEYLSSRTDYLIIGKFLNPYMLGLYTRAFNLMTESITKITGGIYNVLFPAFAAVQHEPEKLRKAYLRTIRTVSYFVFPILGSMLVSAEYIIKGLFGSKWGGAITAFQILAVGGILRTTLSYSGAIAHATGRVFIEVRQQLIYFIILALGAFYAVRFGIEGVATAAVIALTWKFIAQSWLALKIIGSSWKVFIKEMIPGFINLILMIFLNLFLVFILEKFYDNSSYEIKLAAVLIINILAFISALVFVPYSLKGDTFDWLIEKYQKYIPSVFIKFYFSFNAQNKGKDKISTPVNDKVPEK